MKDLNLYNRLVMDMTDRNRKEIIRLQEESEQLNKLFDSVWDRIEEIRAKFAEKDKK